MKILHVIASTGVGGAEKHLLDLCRQQQAGGLDIAVALPTEGALAAALKKQGTPYCLIRAGGRWNPWALWSLRRLIRQIGPDLVHAHMLKSAAMVGLANRSVPCVATAHNIVKRLGPFRFCSHVICVSDMVRDSLCRLGYPESRSSVVYNAVDTQSFGTDKRDSVRSQLGWEDKLVVLCVARLVPAKGQRYAIEAVAQLSAELPELHLVLAGAGPDMGKLARLSAASGVSDRVSFLGTRHDVPDLLAACDLYLQPSLKEGFCIAFLEAMATGLPCIGTATGAIPAMLDSGANGLLITPGDSRAIAEAISSIAVDSERRLSFARAARATARSRFSPARQEADTVEIYRRVLSGR